MEDPGVAIARDQVIAIIVATVFLVFGLAACAAAAIHGRAGVRLLLWQGIFSALYGARILAENPAGLSILPRSMWTGGDPAAATITYLILIPALLFWIEMSLRGLHRFLQIALVAASVNAACGVTAALTSDSPWRFMPYNKAIAVCFLVPLAVVNVVPSLTRRYMAFPSRILTVATSIAAATALYNNLSDWLHLPYSPTAEALTFAVFILCLGYVAAEKVFANERRLLSVENELAIARDIQRSILPESVPELHRLRLAAAYCPMAAVAGDFYEFISVDPNRAGFLVADVSGHGVPAALIASMIKVAMQSVVARADDPREVLRGLNRSLTPQLHGQFVSAAYLWMDTENHQGRYSAAGHPPLLRWRDGVLERIESNGLLIGVRPDPDYPLCELTLRPGDRFLLYTDGVTEPENAAGEAFGDRKLEQTLRDGQSRTPLEVSDRLLAEIRKWQPAPMGQQDDITLLVVDVA